MSFEEQSLKVCYMFSHQFVLWKYFKFSLRMYCNNTLPRDESVPQRITAMSQRRVEFFLGPSPKLVTPGDNKYRVTGSVEAAGLDLKRSTWTPRYFEGYGVVEGEQRGSRDDLGRLV